MRVAIIGGGFTGIACATTLVRSQVDVEVFEKSGFLGGLAAGFREQGWESSVEYYYHHWFKSDKYVEKYLREWNLTNQLRFSRPTTVMETKTHGFVQLDSAMSLLRYPEMTFVQKMRMGLSLAYLKTVRDWTNLDNITARDWCEKWMGKEGFEAIWEPLLIGKFGIEWAQKVNMAWLWSRLFCRTSSLGTYKGGFGKLFEDVESWLKTRNVMVHKNCLDLEVKRGENEKWILRHTGVANEFDAVVVAASPGAFVKIVGSFAPKYAEKVSSRPALGAQVVLLSLKKPLGKQYWYSLRKNSQNPFLALIEHTNFVSAEKFAGEHLIYLADYVDTKSPEWKRSDEELSRLAKNACEHINNKFKDSDVNWIKVFRESYAQPVVGINALKDVPSLNMEEAPNLYHASMAHVYPWDRGTNFALEIGEKVALDLIQRIEK